MLGGGGFATVYAATGPAGRRVAVKVLAPRYTRDPHVQAAFRSESATAAALAHRNVVRILAVGSEGGRAYFAMERHPDSLAARLEREGPLPEAQCLHIMRGIAEALAFAHRRGTVHNDLKAANILLADDGRPVVADFGMANVRHQYVTTSGLPMTVGTPHYLAPEQAQGDPTDGRADIYALGVTTYRAATGRLPFTASEWFELARQHAEEPPPSMCTLVPQLTPSFDRLVLRCLAKRPGDRFATADDLIAEIDSAVGR